MTGKEGVDMPYESKRCHGEPKKNAEIASRCGCPIAQIWYHRLRIYPHIKLKTIRL